jgi:hypothetical protein
MKQPHAPNTGRLLAAARNARPAARPAPEDFSAPPPGFARRVATLWAEERRPAAASWWSPSWRPVAAALALVLASVGLNWSVLRADLGPRELMTRSLSRTFYQP